MNNERLSVTGSPVTQSPTNRAIQDTDAATVLGVHPGSGDRVDALSNEMEDPRTRFERGSSKDALSKEIEEPRTPSQDGGNQDSLSKELEELQDQKKSQNMLPKAQKVDSNASMVPRMSLPHEVAFMIAIIGAQLLTQVGLTMAVAPAYIIGNSFHVHEPGVLSWYAAAYSLTIGTFILPAGRFGDVYGHKKVFVIGWILFSLFSLVAGFSVWVTPGTQGSKFFNVMRAFQGIGPAILLPNAIAILGRTYKQGKRKNMAFSLFGAAAPGGGTVGALFSALIAELAWWPWTFWILAITAFLMMILSILVIPTVAENVDESTAPTEPPTWKSLWTRLDMPGSLTGVLGLVLINISWNQAPIAGWPTPYVYVLLILGSLFMAAFFYIEYTAPHPLIPLHRIGKEVGFVLACIALGWSSFGIWLFYLWQFVLVLRKHSPILAATEFLPPAISGFCASVTTGLLLHKLGPGAIMLFSMVAFCTGNILLATMPVSQTYWAQTFVSLILMPWGMDMSFPSATIIMSNSMPQEHQGMAASLVTTVINYSISLGLGFAGTVQSRILANGGSTLDGYRSAWYMGIGLAGLGILVALAFNAVGILGRGKTEKVEQSEMSA